MYEAKGYIHYSPTRLNDKKYNHSQNWWMVLNCRNEDISNYYRHLYYLSVNKTSKILGTSYGDHLTIIRGHKEVPVNKELWKVHEGKELKFYYWNEIIRIKDFYHMKVHFPMGGSLRKELGLKPEPNFPFHLTLGMIDGSMEIED